MNIIEYNIKNEQHKEHHAHGVLCSCSCDHEEHLRTGYSTTCYNNFSTESVFDQVDCGVKAYLDLMDSFF